ncbi:unnamed protein product [Microthlaspi erraticum]|uniref:Uncharacterized protein n=1 Tax=Microthlaspi erraticum TaxID=1685480 RepID=A0A6D2I568_9BRAS|nr:unnamed protein product [Microthlaspi erraticum]
MSLRKTSLLFYFLFFFHFQHNLLSVDSRSLRQASVDTSHVTSIPKLAVFIRKGGGGRGGGGRGGGGVAGKAVGHGGLKQARSGLGGYPFFVVASHQSANPSSGSRNLGWTGRGFGWLTLSVFTGIVLVS